MELAKDVELAEIAGGVASAALVFALGTAAIRSGSEVRILENRVRVERELGAVARNIRRELDEARAALVDLARSSSTDDRRQAAERLAGDARSVWQFDGERVELLASGTPQVDAYFPSQRAEAGEVRFELVPTADGRDVLMLRAPIAEAEGWTAVVLDALSLWSSSGLLDLARGGVDVAIADGVGRPIYWSSPTELVDPVSATVDLADHRLELTATRRGGWADARMDWSSLILSIALAVAYGIAYLLLARRPRALVAERQHLNERLLAKDEDLAAVLRERAQLETRLEVSLALDPHTGLPNRVNLIEHVDARLAERRRCVTDGVLLAAVHFRELETLGHSLGTTMAHKLVVQAADRLQEVGSRQLLARTGDRELMLCLPLSESTKSESVAKTILGALGHPFVIDGRRVYQNAVVGIALCNDGYGLGAELVDHAGLAAEDAVSAPEGWCVFHERAQQQRADLLRLEADLANALESNEFKLAFQPIVRMGSSTIVGFEALLRWEHPTESLLSPDRFMPLAEGMGLMRQISEWVVREGIQQSKVWLPLRDNPVYVSLNLTPRDLNPVFRDRLFALLHEADVPAEAICVEVTETAVVRDFRSAARLINELNERGIRVLLDDFGTGYSSLSYLRELPFRSVKIDKSFIRRMGHDSRDFGLVRSIVSLVHYLGMECVAEGVETQEDLDLLAMVDCDYWQGYLYSKPVAASEVERLLAGRSSSTRAVAI